MRVLDLFSGIGGFSLGLERAGFKTVAFCEIEPYCRAVLRKHWPDVPIYDDVRTLTAGRLANDGIAVDVICGGFPCQDISLAGKGAGIEGERSGLWSEYARIIGEVRPRYVIVENVAALLGRGLSRVLGDLATLGYDAEWHCIPACAVGAPHRRDRLWIVAYASSERRQQVAGSAHGDEGADEGRPAQYDHKPASHGEGDRAAIMSDSDEPRLERWLRRQLQECTGERIAGANCSHAADADGKQTRWIAEPWHQCGQWRVEPDVGRVADGIPARVDRLRALGNAVVPQIPEIIGRAIMNAAA